jgi:RecA/RadA recombinase
MLKDWFFYRNPHEEGKYMSLKDKLIKNSTIDYTSTLTDSKIYTKKDVIPTPVPVINVALSGSVDGGLTPGLTMLAGPSKHFKTGFALLMAAAFLKKYKDGIILFYDSEFGTPQSYFKAFGIPFDSVIHTPIMDVEQLKFDIMQQFKGIEREDHVLVIIDSIGNLASKKEVDDALDGKSVADMTRAKQLKSLFRMITPHLSLKDIPLVAVNHTYEDMGMYPKQIVGGGTGAYYGADNIWILGRQQDKVDNEIAGYHFIINIEKSRYVKEKSRIPITVSYDGGINRWSGLLDVAMEGGYIVKPKVGWYATVDRTTGEVKQPSMRANDFVFNKEFWMKMFSETDFAKYLENKYKVSHGAIMENEDDVVEANI